MAGNSSGNAQSGGGAVQGMQTAGAIAGGMAKLNEAGPKHSPVGFNAPHFDQQSLLQFLQGAAGPSANVQNINVPQAGQMADLNLLDVLSKFSGGGR